MSHTLTYRSIQNVQLCYHHVGRGIGPYAQAQAHAYAHIPANAHNYAPTPAHAQANTLPHAQANATAPHPLYCAAGSTSVICKMTILWRRSPFMDDLVKSNTPLYFNTDEGPL
ncbi:hypothetical protein O181_017444 [Austropuccinia psidii MF-1]|uniref:Uncharacterized protein n=1 Tax=Austropuccinia psidii MF-1 TaxID=1389203 RepID=A0A9Q3GSS3_9BASI|nr:hypothetical protein [Austropuccinia psidii MF-1]